MRSEFLKFHFTSFLIFSLLIAVTFLLSGCEGGDNEKHADIDKNRFIFKQKIGEGIPVPYAIFFDDVNKYSFEWQNASLYLDGSSIEETVVKRGVAVGVISNPGTLGPNTHGYFLNFITPTANIEKELVVLAHAPVKTYSGTLTGEELSWGSDTIAHVVGDITVEAGNTLNIDAGAVIVIPIYTSLNIYGTINVQGEADNPVVFVSEDEATSWGEINIENGSGNFSWTFFTGGGGDASREFGHSNSQPVIRATSSQVYLEKCFFVNNPGKAFGTNQSEIHLDSCIISNCDTGGEYWASKVTMENSWVMNIPDDTENEIDDDNDCIYLNNVMDGDTEGSLIKNCAFSTGKDDGIDHNGAIVKVEDCIIEDFDNEGIAASNMNRIEVYNTLVKNCEQGIEAGYGSPEVIVNHCLLINNETGLRFGDWYTWRDPSGTMSVRNTISVNNSLHNAWNWVASTEEPLEGALGIQYSLVNDELYNTDTGNITGEVQLTEEYLLELNSAGISASDDGSDMGLLP